ncbi:hypothetical protein E4T56_gene14114 [Termitomyces sp. T112]|nr:hypothetical protein E4T56_gene14114 [Termitomyces sp. T112]KAH0590890.1 hypothetical protein H2248_001006 [Termitomyces sp. 'cryptogamus']
MSNFTSSYGEVKFVHPEYFVQSGSLDEWICKICTSGSDVDYMTLKTAQHHERHSAEHTRNAIEVERRQWVMSEPDASGWDQPRESEPVLTKEEVKMRESQIHVDLVRDMVPFWIRGMEAAERGEVLRLEEFLAKLETESSWEGSVGEDGWGEGVEWGNGWGDSVVTKKKRARRQTRNNAYEFVEDVARQEAADPERRRRMHRFFEMPTDEKLRRIRALVH